MVFQSRKNCRGAAQALPKSVLTKLPDELLLKLLHQMDITEVLRLRETSRFFVDTCTEVMRDKLKILYVHPSPSSVARAISICKKSDLSSEVEEICFLSKAPLRQDDYRITLHQRQWAFHNPRDDVERPVPPFSHTYQELLSSLAKLEGLHTFSFRESCDRPGFNALSTQRINNWQDTLAHHHGQYNKDSTCRKKGRIENTLLFRPGDTFHVLHSKPKPPMAFLFADVDALDAVLNSGINFTRLILPHELFGNLFSYHVQMLGIFVFHRPPPSILRIQTLTHLDVTATAKWIDCAWHVHCAELLYAVAATLLELKIGI